MSKPAIKSLPPLTTYGSIPEFKLTYRARLRLSMLCAQQTGSLDDSEIWNEIGIKVEVPKSTKDSLIKDLGNGQVIVDEEMLDADPSESIELEKAERRKLVEVLKTWKGYDRFDARWNRKLVKELEDSLAQ